MNQVKHSIPNQHFEIHEIANGVFAVIAKNGGAAIANAGIIDLGHSTLVFDTFLTTQAAQDLRTAAVELTGHDPEIIINSHYHNDHIWGNQVFNPQAHIISTLQTRNLILTEGKAELEWALGNSATRLEEFSKQYQDAQSEHERRELLLWVGYYQGLIEDLPRLKVRLPDITFDKRLTIHGQSRQLDLLSFEEAHSGNDTILYLREDGIIFMADLLFVGCHPYLAECDVFKLLDALKEIEKMDASIFVPGHGQVGSRKDLTLMTDYITLCLDKSKSLIAQGNVNEERIAQAELPGKYSSWELSRFFQINIRSLCERIAEK